MKHVLLLLMLTACAAPTSPRSPIIGAVAFAPGVREVAAFARAEECATAQGAERLASAPRFDAVRWYGVNAPTFIFRYGLSEVELVGRAGDGIITIALEATDIPTIEAHEVLHLLIGDPGHTRAAFWFACGLLRGIGTTDAAP